MSLITASPVRMRVYRAARGLSPVSAREACIRALASDALAERPQRVVIERDESVLASDVRWLHEQLGPRQHRTTEFQHLVKHEDPLLWVADALAWCLQRGRPWTELISGVRRIETTVT